MEQRVVGYHHCLGARFLLAYRHDILARLVLYSPRGRRLADADERHAGHVAETYFSAHWFKARGLNLSPINLPVRAKIVRGCWS